MLIPQYSYWLPALASFLASIFGVLLVSYLREKGKNLATKSDIGQITKIVEETKSNYSRQTEMLRAELNTIVNTRNSMNEEIRKGILDFWDHAALLLSLCDTTRGELDEERYTEIDHFMQEIERVENELVLKHARLYFLLDDQELIDLSDDIFRNVTRRHGKFALFVIKAKPLITEMGKSVQGIINAQTLEQNQQWWMKYNKCENDFEKECEEIDEELEKAIEQFKLKAKKMVMKEMVV